MLFNCLIVEEYSILDLENIVTPVNVQVYNQLLIELNFPDKERKCLVNGFTRGFSIGYKGPTNRRQTTRNLPFKCGTKFDVWEKIMKEVKLAGMQVHFRKYLVGVIF